MNMAGYSPLSGEWALIAATLAAIQLAQGQTVDQLAFMASFFGVLGNNLGLLAITRAETKGETTALI
jgi:hypothetical protein